MIAYTYIYSLFAQAYGDGAYGSCTYDCANGQPSPEGGLVNTGVVIIGVITVACLLALIALLVRFWRRPRSKK